MDLYCEYLVKKKSKDDALKRAGLIFLCVFLCLFVCFLALFVFHAIIAATPILIAAIIFGTVILTRNYSLEFEYIFINGALDVDVIKGRAKRANLCSLSCRKIEDMRPLPRNYTPQNKVINAIYDENRRGKYVVTFFHNGEKTDLLFQPPETLLQNMKKYNPRNIHLD